MKMLSTAEWDELQAYKAEAERLRAIEAIVNTPELIDFPKAVMLEAQHQEVRWGTEDRESKSPADWFRLVTHLSTRALEHHKEADRLEEVRAHAERDAHPDAGGWIVDQIAYHREKAVHHTITTAAALNHWHASVLGKHTKMRPGYVAPAEASA